MDNESAYTLYDGSENSNGSDLADFKHDSSTDQIHREYDPPRFQSVSASWKLGRPTYLRSWFRCIFHSVVFTALCGAGLAVVPIFIVWLNLNLGAMCLHFNNTWYEMPISIQKALLTLQVIECMIIQCWYLSIVVPVFGWKLIKDLNILPWTILVASIDALYRLLLNVYHTYNRTWSSCPMNLLFATSLFFVSHKVASQYRQNTRQRLGLAFRLGVPFYVGFPVALVINYVLLYYFNRITEDSKAVLASLSPALVIIPKAIARLCAERMEGLNHPGTSVVLLLPIYAGLPILFRLLQAKLHGFWTYFALSIVHAITGTFHKITLPLQDYLLHRYCAKSYKRQHGYVSKYRKPRVNRLYADLAIVSFVAESSAITVSSVVIQICRYHYGRDCKGQKYDVTRLLKAGCWQVMTGIIVELIFNTVAIKVLTYYYNIPVMRVWKKNKLWIIAVFLTQTIISIFYFGDYFLNSLRSNTMFDRGIIHKCKEPFH